MENCKNCTMSLLKKNTFSFQKECLNEQNVIASLNTCAPWQFSPEDLTINCVDKSIRGQDKTK